MEAGSYVANGGSSFQVGTVGAQGSAWESAHFYKDFSGVPAVITHVQSTHDPHFVKTRQRSSDKSGFQVALEREGSRAASGGSAGGHGQETVGWMAFETGHGSIGNLQYEAGNTPGDVTEQVYTVNYARAFSTTPKFYASIATTAGQDSSQLRQAGRQSPAAQSFVIEEEECSDDERDCGEAIAGNGCHTSPEVVSWLSMAASLEHTGNYDSQQNSNDASTIMGRHALQSLKQIGEQGTASVNTLWLTVDLSQTYRNPVVFCSIPSLAGSDPVACRVRKVRFAPPHQIVRIDPVTGQQNNHAETDADSCPGGGWCFDIALQEPQCLDQYHKQETVSWMIMDEGTFHSDDGSQFQVGKAQVASSGWTTVRFRGTGFATTPATITQIQSVNGVTCGQSDNSGGSTASVDMCEVPGEFGSSVIPGLTGIDTSTVDETTPVGFLKTRQFRPSMYSLSMGWEVSNDARQYDTQYFFCALEDSSSRDGVGKMETLPETVGWAAFSAHHGTLGEMTYEAGTTPEWMGDGSWGSVGEQPYDIVFQGFFRFAPSVFGNIASYHGDDSAELRTPVGGITAAKATILIEEEQCTGEADAPPVHGNHEVVDYFAMLPGVGSHADGDHGGIFGRPSITSDSASTNHVKAGETGRLTLDNNWATVALKSYYFRPVIIAGSPSSEGGQPVVARIRNIRHGHGCAGWCFDIRLQEPGCEDDVHKQEAIDWLAIEAGSWSGDEGDLMQAGLLEIEGDMRVTGSQFHRVPFLSSFSKIPVVLSQVMTYFGSNFVKTRQQQGDSTFFEVALEEAGDVAAGGTQHHTNFEKVGGGEFIIIFTPPPPHHV
jgi:hypothetical protein